MSDVVRLSVKRGQSRPIEEQPEKGQRRRIVNLDAIGTIAALMAQQRVLYDLLTIENPKPDLDNVEIRFQGTTWSGLEARALMDELREDELWRAARMAGGPAGRTADRLRNQVRRAMRRYGELRRAQPEPPARLRGRVAPAVGLSNRPAPATARTDAA